jgi:hypothetical protein
MDFSTALLKTCVPQASPHSYTAIAINIGILAAKTII